MSKFNVSLKKILVKFFEKKIQKFLEKLKKSDSKRVGKSKLEIKINGPKLIKNNLYGTYTI